MQHTIYLLKNGLVVQLDWHCCITVGAVIFPILYISFLIIIYIYSKHMQKLQSFGKGSWIRPLLVFWSNPRTNNLLDGLW